MELQLTLRFNIDDPASGTTRRFVKSVNVRMPHVPRIGEAVVIPGDTVGTNLGARRVEDVIYAPDGTVILDLRLDGLTNDVESQVTVLRAGGFRELEK
ncbi:MULTISPECIES: hypothetical protein [unclassified Saccharothrix]|uniref:hypothetical protein n=1 Tax=unclassified Saccharothrix TaxID=2593673 RepID=UPI00307E1B5B